MGWLPRQRVQGLLGSGQLAALEVAELREPDTLYLACRGEAEGRALGWWHPALARRLTGALPAPASPAVGLAGMGPRANVSAW